MAATIEIRKGKEFVIKTDKNNLMVINGSSDGIVFQFKNGFHIYYTDTRMPVETKEKIRITLDKIQAGNIIVDLMNYMHPTQLIC